MPTKMAESQKRDCSVTVKEKGALQDLEIGKDFFSSWKSISMADGDELDFDFTPVSKGNKKSFDFGKADMDFNLDGDFGKMSSFNVDMSDLDISLPLKNDGKSKEKPKDPSSGKENGKTDRFAFAFDFDELENFSFDSSLTKDCPKAQREKNNTESPTDGNGCQDKEGPTCTNVIGSTSTLEDGPQKPSLPEAQITFDMDCLVGGSAYLEPTRKTYSNLAMDDAATSEHSTAIDGVASDKKSPAEIELVSRELPNSSQSGKLVSPGPVDLEALTGNGAMLELSSDCLSKNEPSGGNSSEAQNKTDSMNTNSTGSDVEQDANNAGSTCKKHTLSKNSQLLHNINNEKSRDVPEDHATEDTGRTELGPINALVEKSSTTIAVSGILCDTPSDKKNQKPASEILEFPLISQPADVSEKQTENGRKPLVKSSQPFIQTEKPECPLLKVSAQTTFSSLSSKKMGSVQPSLVEGKRHGNTLQGDQKLVSLPLQHPKTQLTGKLSQIWSRESCNALKISGEMGSADWIQNGKKMNDSSDTQNKDMVKAKPAMRQREMSVKGLDILSVEINNKAAKNSENLTSLVWIPTMKNTPVEEHGLSSTEGGRKNLDLPGLKLTGLTLDSTKSPIRKDIKSVGNRNQKSILLRKTPDIARFPDKQKQTPSTLSMKRMLEDNAANNIALHPSKRLSHSASTSRDLVETPEKVLNKKAPSQSHMEDDCIKNTNGSCQVTAIHIPHEVTNKGTEILFLTENDSNVKPADVYSKKLDDLCNILRRKNDEAKEILARAIVNNNKLLMLNNPRFEEKHSWMKASARAVIFHMKANLVAAFATIIRGTEIAFSTFPSKNLRVLSM